MSGYFASEQELEAIVRGLETCTTPEAEFPHRSHLVVASWYLNNATVGEALQKMRAGILNFLDHYQIEGKYNETITLFWIIMVERYLRNLDTNLPLVERTNAVVEALSDSGLMFEYYSRELLWSERAMREFVNPDLKSLE
ncbi:MAG: hypothetical protein M3R68_00390 [Acidobacteriota bacterium]|nr:hypothetical protein [Acidobacteriota bacterium]